MPVKLDYSDLHHIMTFFLGFDGADGHDDLAREIGADVVLPSAFYELSRYTFAQIFEPAPGEPLEAPPPPASASAPSSSSSAPPPSPVSACTLSPEDMRRLALGKEAAAQAVTALIVSMEHNGLGFLVRFTFQW